MASRADLGMPENWERTVRWLRNKIARKEESAEPVPEKKQRANPELPILHKYEGLTLFFKDKKSKRVTKKGSRNFLLFLHDDRRIGIRIHTYD